MRGRRQAGTTLLEFAIAWPVALLLVLGAVEYSVWSAESAAARQAAAAVDRAVIFGGADLPSAQQLGVALLGSHMVGTSVTAWCPDTSPTPAGPWLCVTVSGDLIETRVGGTVPALVSLLPGGAGLPISADVPMSREAFQP